MFHHGMKESTDDLSNETPSNTEGGLISKDDTVSEESPRSLSQPSSSAGWETAVASAPAVVKKGKKRKAETSSKASDDDVIKPSRTWELWSTDDKLFFFEALNEVGKDFDKILTYFQSKFKNKKLPEYIKNKNQIRHFYYRSWHKISSYINFGPDIKKSTKELFGLINYGVLWKKVGDSLDRRRGALLDELVQKGCVTIKHKGKSFRVKTPLCKALKNIHNKDVDSSSANNEHGLRLPKKVVIELKPLETKDWVRVQGMAQNPHVKVTLGLDRTLASLLACLASKWRSQDEKTLESLKEAEDKASEPPEDELVLFPLPSAKINNPFLSVAPVLRSSNLSLQSLKSESKPKVKLDLMEEGTLVTEVNGNRISGSGQATDAAPTQTPICDNKAAVAAVLDEGEPEELLEDSEGESSRSPVPPPDLAQDKESDPEVDNEDEEEDTVKEEVCKDVKSNFTNLQNFDRSRGWSLSSAGNITVGEVYCLLGGLDNPHIELEYHWRKIKVEVKTDESTEGAEAKSSSPSKDECQNVLSRLVRLSSSMPGRPGRGRQTSLSSPSLRNNMSPVASSNQNKAGRGRKNSLSSPTARNGLSPVSSPLASRSPTTKIAPRSRGAVKKLPLISDQPDKPGTPLAVPLKQQETEFRKPLAPAIKPAPLPANFQKQLGQYFPRFSNRRGRQSKSRSKNLVGRQVLQPIAPQGPRIQLIPAITTIETLGSMPQAGNQIILQATPVSIINAMEIQEESVNHALIKGPPMSPIRTPNSPPQICIPSPAPSPARRTPSPTPSLSSFMDIFPVSAPVTPSKSDNFMHHMMDEGSLLQTPPRALSPGQGPTSPSRCLADSADVSLTSWSLNFDSPIKQSASALSVIHHNDDSQTSTISTNSEVDRQLTAMMNENSLDFTSTFRQLAKHVTSNDQELSNS